MSKDRKPEPPTPSTPNKRPDKAAPRLPTWVTVVVVLVLLGLLAYNIVVVGPEGLPTSYLIGGLLGAYAGVDQLLKRRDDDDKGKGPP